MRSSLLVLCSVWMVMYARSLRPSTDTVLTDIPKSETAREPTPTFFTTATEIADLREDLSSIGRSTSGPSTMERFRHDLEKEQNGDVAAKPDNSGKMKRKKEEKERLKDDEDKSKIEVNEKQCAEEEKRLQAEKEREQIEEEKRLEQEKRLRAAEEKRKKAEQERRRGEEKRREEEKERLRTEEKRRAAEQERLRTEERMRKEEEQERLHAEKKLRKEEEKERLRSEEKMRKEEKQERLRAEEKMKKEEEKERLRAEEERRKEKKQQRIRDEERIKKEQERLDYYVKRIPYISTVSATVVSASFTSVETTFTPMNTKSSKSETPVPNLNSIVWTTSASEQLCGRRTTRSGRIVGGDDTFPGEFPWAVSVRIVTVHHCGGTIINKYWVLTAAHCVKRYAARYYSVRPGVFNIHEINYLPMWDIKVKEIVVHPHFGKPRRYSNDVALLKLKKAVSFNLLTQPICLPSPKGKGFDGWNATVVGWGWLDEDEKERPTLMQKVIVPVLNNTICAKWYSEDYNRYFEIDGYQICAGYKEGGKDACEGDSGGPLVTKGRDNRYTIIGVVSAGVGCARKNLPGLYSRVSFFVPWILQVTGQLNTP